MRSACRFGLLKALLVGGTACAAGPGLQSHLPAAAIDGKAADWSRVPALLRDPADAPHAELDLLEIKARDDGRHFDLLLDLARPASLQGLEGSLRILLNTDDDSTTGEMRDGLPGVDLVLAFSHPDSAGRRLGGAAILYPSGMSPYALDLHLAPVYAARYQELSFVREPAFPGRAVAFKLIYADQENIVRDETAVARFSFRDIDEGPRVLSPAPPAAPERSFRVLAWNVSDYSIRRNAGPFLQVIRSIAPDILLLDEVSGESSAAEIMAWFNGPGANEWRVAFGTSGGYQRGVIAARTPIESVAEFASVPYSSETVEALVGMAPDSAGRLRTRRSLADGIGISAATGIIEGHPVLLVTLDLWCCGTPGSPEEKRRLVEAARVNQLVRETVARGVVQGVIMAGDLNLVATRAPLDLLRQGADLDGTSLAIAAALQLDGRDATWYGPFGRYLPSRLDYSLFSGSTLEAIQAFVFDPRDLGTDWLGEHGIDPQAVMTATDHFPVVVDFRWKATARR